MAAGSSGAAGCAPPRVEQFLPQGLDAMSVLDEEAVLARAVELEGLLAADLARKPAHQKPRLQTAWREEPESLYRRLD